MWVAVAAAPAARAAETPDPAKLAELRSLAAEAAMLDAAEARGRVTRAFAQALRQDLRDGLKKLADDPALGSDAKAALAALAARDDGALAALRDRLVVQERSHGRAD